MMKSQASLQEGSKMETLVQKERQCDDNSRY